MTELPHMVLNMRQSKTGSQLATFDSDIDDGFVRLLATPTSSSSTVFKVIATLTKV